jgi:hypothetical protein
MTEAEYDEHIAPALMDIANKVAALGGSLIARVEWERDEAGITSIGVTEASGISQKLTAIAAHTQGNIDALCMSALKNFDCSNSIVLGHYQRESRQ